MRTVKVSCTVAITCLFLSTAPAWAINKCVNPQGQVSYQDAPCSAGTSASAVQVKPLPIPATSVPNSGASQQTPPAVVAPPSTSAQGNLPFTTTVVPMPLPYAAPSPLQLMAERCLDWYRPRLRDPRGAYLQNPGFEKGVLTMTVFATNGYGGYVSKPAACEFKNGNLDADWTKIHAERAGW